uniref:Uncharacterized protein n=1 Tax=Sphaerodactylus townsendi TaxID=933632 RepID=A0ACB8GEJ5_9SAUR
MEMKILEAKADAAATKEQMNFLKRKEEIIEEQAHLKAQEADPSGTSSPVEAQEISNVEEVTADSEDCRETEQLAA